MDNDVEIFLGLQGCLLLEIRYRNYQQVNCWITYQTQVLSGFCTSSRTQIHMGLGCLGLQQFSNHWRYLVHSVNGSLQKPTRGSPVAHTNGLTRGVHQAGNSISFGQVHQITKPCHIHLAVAATHWNFRCSFKQEQSRNKKKTWETCPRCRQSATTRNRDYFLMFSYVYQFIDIQCSHVRVAPYTECVHFFGNSCSKRLHVCALCIQRNDTPKFMVALASSKWNKCSLLE